MLHLALSLIHNKNAATNRNQISTLVAVTTTVFVPLLDDNGQPVLNELGEPIGETHYTITGLAIEHVVRFYQIMPFGVSRPNNFNSLNSHNVYYGESDKIGTHPRFYNWSIKRPLDQGADIVAIVTDHTQFSVAGLQLQINRLVNRRLLVIPLWGVAINTILFREVGQFREDLSFLESLADLRARIAARGWESD